MKHASGPLCIMELPTTSAPPRKPILLKGCSLLQIEMLIQLLRRKECLAMTGPGHQSQGTLF